MNLHDHAADAVLTKVSYVTTGAASVAAGSGVVLGLTQAEWAVFGIIGGFVVAVVGVIANSVISWHFKSKHYRLQEAKAMGVLDALEPEE